MRRLILFALVSWPLWSQVPMLPTIPVEVTLKPRSLKASRDTLNNKTVGLWTFSVCQDTALAVTVDRVRVMAAISSFGDLPNAEAKDILTRATNTSTWSLLAIYGKEALDMSATGFGVGAAVTGSPVLAFIGGGAGLASFLVNRAHSRAPDPTNYIANLLPDTLTLQPGKCSTSYYLIAGLQPKAAGFSKVITIPYVAAGAPAAVAIRDSDGPLLNPPNGEWRTPTFRESVPADWQRDLASLENRTAAFVDRTARAEEVTAVELPAWWVILHGSAAGASGASGE